MTKVGEHITLDIIGTINEYDPLVYERVIKGENNTEYIKTVCYPSNFNFALKKASEELLNTSRRFTSLKEYIDEYRGIQEKISNVIQ